MKILHLLVSGKVGGAERLCVDVAKYSKQDNYFYFAWQGGELTDLIKVETDKVYVDNFQYKKIITVYQRIKKYCLENEIDVVVVHNSASILRLYGAWLTKSLNCRLYMYAHSDAKKFLRYRGKVGNFFLRRIYHYAYSRSACIIAISKFVLQSVQHELGNDCRVELCYNGIDLSRFEMTKDYKKDTLIYVGRLDKEKGVDLMIRAISKMKNNPQVKIVGYGSEQENLQKLSVELGIEHQVDFVGKQLDVEKWLRQATIFVHSCQWEEGFGLTLIEAMAEGVPCVAVKKGAIPEIINNGVDGFIVEKRDTKDLAAKLDEVLEISRDKKQWDKIRANARKKAEQFSILNMIKRQEEIYRK